MNSFCIIFAAKTIRIIRQQPHNVQFIGTQICRNLGPWKLFHLGFRYTLSRFQINRIRRSSYRITADCNLSEYLLRVPAFFFSFFYSLIPICWQICAHCGQKGASIGCRARHCKSLVHYSCALYTGWDLNPDTFIAVCYLHKVSA